MSKIVHHSPKPATMTSIELADVINEARRIEAAGTPFIELRHDNLMAKIVKVLGDAAPKFSGTVVRPQPAGGSREYPCYHLPKREAELVAMSESYAVQARVYDRMIELEAQQLSAPAGAPALRLPLPAKELRAALSIAKMLGLTGNQAILSANRAVTNITGINLMAELGATHLEADSQSMLFTPTQLGKRACITGMQFNQRLSDAGMQERKDNVWVPTAKGRLHSKVLDTDKKHDSGAPVQQVKWLESVLGEVAL